MEYWNRRNFHTRFNFVFFGLLAECMKFCSIQKPCTHTSVCDTVLAVQKFMAYESPRTPEYEFFTRTKVSVITGGLPCFSRIFHGLDLKGQCHDIQ